MNGIGGTDISVCATQIHHQTQPDTPPEPMLETLISRTSELFRQLADRPALLYAVCFAANAVCLPYTGIFHDAELYAVQVLHAANGSYAEDLFFRFGGQSGYTLLPALLGGLADQFGVRPVFLIAYILGNAARLAATQWLVFRLLGRSPAVAAGLFLNAIARVPLGCAAVFLVNEPFFTARVPALALAIAGLDQALAGRPWRVAGLLAASLVLHPLIAAPAIAVTVVWAAWQWANTPRRAAIVGAAAALAGLAVIGYLAATAGRLDPEWRRLVIAKSSIIDPLAWPLTDRLRLLVAGGCAVAAGGLNRANRRFLWVIVAAAIAGVLVSIGAARGSWTLLFQGQAFRAVWPLELLRLPVGLFVVARLWAGGAERRLGAVALFAGLTASSDLLRPTAGPVFAGAVILAAVAYRLFARGPAAGELWRPLAVGLTLWAVAWYGGFVPDELREINQVGIFERLAWADRLQILQDHFGPLPRFVLALAAITALAWLLPRPRPLAGAALAVGVMVPFLADAASRLERFKPQTTNAHFVRGVLAERWPGTSAPTVYWPCGTVRTLWLDLHVNSYFNLTQLAGNAYSRATAIEGNRRVAIVMPFEIERFRRDFGRHTRLTGEDLGDLYRLPPPSEAEFRKLAADPAVDFLILPTDFGDAVATNGSVWVYDCRDLRKAGFAQAATP
jgi:hypothetical protein